MAKRPKSGEAAAPIIVIKRVKKGGHGHHGGAWKVAFADFVTAMMAFFLLLWLLGSTTEDQKRGISDYFMNPVGQEGVAGASNSIIDMGGGMNIPSGAGENPDQLFPEEGIEADSGKQTLDDPEFDPQSLSEQALELELQRLEQLKEQLERAIEQSEQLAQFKDQLLLDITSEGLRIQIVDKENRPMFDLGSSTLKIYTRAILREIVGVISLVPNRISISGHTDQSPFISREGYSNWELSADRANAARRELVTAGLPEAKLGRVVGLASSVLFNKEEPLHATNRRISIIVMNKAAEDSLSYEGDPLAEPAPHPDASSPELPTREISAEPPAAALSGAVPDPGDA